MFLNKCVNYTQYINEKFDTSYSLITLFPYYLIPLLPSNVTFSLQKGNYLTKHDFMNI